MTNSILSLLRLTQKSRNLMLADIHSHQFKDLDNVRITHIKRDFYLAKNEIIIQTLFWFGLRSFSFAAVFDDEAIEKWR